MKGPLEAEDFTVEAIFDGDEADTRLAEGKADLVLLDTRLSGLPGLTICHNVRKRDATRTLPIIIVTAMSEEVDRVKGLDAGADDYVVSPFSTSELIARIRSLLRRAQSFRSVPNIIESGDIVVDVDAKRVRRAGRIVHLASLEFALLEYLIKRPGRVISRQHLREALWRSATAVIDRTIDVTIGRLRKALTQEGEPDPIKTVRHEGYKFDDGRREVSAGKLR